VRRIADLLRLSLVVGAVRFLVIGEPRLAWAMGLMAVTALAVRAVRAPAWSDLLFVALLTADAWLTMLGAFSDFNRNDTAGHLLLCAAVTPLLFHLLRRGPLAAAAGTVAVGAAWEVVEAASDALIGTNMSLGAADTLGDLAADALGAGLAAALLASSVGYSTVTVFARLRG
jgi:hypothetical protein